MCGIIACLSTYSDEKIDQAMKAMQYRGLDGVGGVVRRGDWTIGHVRLPIQTPASHGVQPWSRRPGKLSGFVGELFDHPGVSELDSVSFCLDNPQGFLFQDGFWAVVDTDGLTLDVYTDHLGIKPMYFWPERGIVCSEIAPMFELAGKPLLNWEHMGRIGQGGYPRDGSTPWRGIFQMFPGQKLTMGKDRVLPSCSTYWDWDLVPRRGPVPLRDLITRAVEQRIGNSILPVSLLLSGGMDSSIIYYTITELLGKEVRVYSVDNDETEFLPENEDIIFLPSPDKASYSEAVDWMQTPLDLGSVFPQITLAKKLKEHGEHVVLTGDGADELFGGYRRYGERDAQKDDVFGELPFYHLPRLDRVMMRATVELRSPFLSPTIVARALDLPWKPDRYFKQVLKDTYRGLVPDRILDREKKPLKSKQLLSNPKNHQKKMRNAFYERYVDTRNFR